MKEKDPDSRQNGTNPNLQKNRDEPCLTSFVPGPHPSTTEKVSPRDHISAKE